MSNTTHTSTTHTSPSRTPAPRARRSAAHLGRRGRAAHPPADGDRDAPRAPAPPFTGVVVDAATGEPLAAAHVAVIGAAARLAAAPARPADADGAGRFRLARLPAGGALVVARAEGYLPEVAAVAGGAAHVVLALARAGAVAGALTTRGGAPLAGVRVRAVSPEAMDLGDAVTDGAGRFLVASLRPGRYRVDAGGRSVEVDVRAGARTGVALVADA
jgi:hypothetical protein